MHRGSLLWVLIAVGAATSRVSAQVAAESVDSALLALVRQLVADSVRGAGTRVGQRYVAGDSASHALLRAAGVELHSGPASPLTCPGSTTTTEEPVPPPVGYHVRIALRVASDTAARILAVTKSCAWVYRGAPMRGFREGVTWELRRTGGAWQIARTLRRSVT